MTTMLLTMLFADTRLIGSAVRVTTQAQARRLLKAGKLVFSGPDARDLLEDVPHAL